MHRSTLLRTLRRSGALTALALASVVAVAGPAAAHADVEAEGARALDQNVELTFSAASESTTAGITKLEVILPEGLVPADIAYEKGPDGWKFAPTSRGYTVSGEKRAVGEDVEYVVTVRQLPDAESLVFKTLQSYSDGKVDRWIELEESEEDGHHGHPAPRLDLKAAAPGAKPVSPTPSEEPTTAAPEAETTPESDARTPSAQPAADSTDGDDGLSPAVPLGIGAAVLVAVGGGVWWLRSRRGGTA
ncbi:DUF1775 domain-containing protein [Streptomyces sp. DSM 3412]|uniref:DUF1775 domain-containing protein n=1 Tax=Streptomyces gottesmaniae TaxID=3075518 RepID=A0ABU2ZA08_9ACTN|nr:DUF1775 domain-containing protein [Streptomyces sp. DSM 3412]MDT0573433.1 DUF1775 domain-containing protein [Streptomyces sp. DSM 3412]